jgi:hypothetical protein
VNIDRETVRKILTEDLDMKMVCEKNGPKGAHSQALLVRKFLTTKQIAVRTPCLFTESSP